MSNTPTMPPVRLATTQARLLADYLRSIGLPIKHTQALEGIARVNLFRNRHEASIGTSPRLSISPLSVPNNEHNVEGQRALHSKPLRLAVLGRSPETTVTAVPPVEPAIGDESILDFTPKLRAPGDKAVLGDASRRIEITWVQKGVTIQAFGQADAPLASKYVPFDDALSAAWDGSDPTDRDPSAHDYRGLFQGCPEPHGRPEILRLQVGQDGASLQVNGLIYFACQVDDDRLRVTAYPIGPMGDVTNDAAWEFDELSIPALSDLGGT